MPLAIPGVIARWPVPDDAIVGMTNFTMPTGTGDFIITTTTLQGVTPKGVMLFVGGGQSNETTHSTSLEYEVHLVGASDGTNSWATAGSNQSGTNADSRGYSSSKILWSNSPSLAATFVSWEKNGVKINVSSIATELQGNLAWAFFLGGVDVTVAAGFVDNPTNTGLYTNIGFAADAVIFSDARSGTTETPSTTCLQTLGFSLNTAGLQQYSGTRWRASGSGVSLIQRHIGGQIGSTFCDVTSYDATGFTVAWDLATSGDVCYFAFKLGATMDVELNFLRTGIATGVRTTGGIGLTPDNVMFIMGAGELDVTVTGSGYGVGWLTSTGGGSVWGGSGVDRSSNTRIDNINAGEVAEHSSFDLNSMDLDFINNDATERIWPFLAFGGAGSGGDSTKYENTGGTGNRTGIITATSDMPADTGDVTKLINGVIGTNEYDWADLETDRYLKFDFGSGNSKIIDEFRWYQHNNNTHGTWQFQGSNNDTDWDNLGATFTLGGGPSLVHGEMSQNVTGYRYYRLLQTAGASDGGVWIREIEFKIGDA